MTADMPMDIPIKPRVLIADDSRIVRATLARHLEPFFEAREAVDGEQAWETLLLDDNIRVLVTDLAMPRLDGIGLLQRIRSCNVDRIRALPVMVMSGTEEGEQRERARAAGASDLISKGIDTRQLLARVGALSGPESATARRAGLERVLPPESWRTSAAMLLAQAVNGPGRRDFLILNLQLGIVPADRQRPPCNPPAPLVDDIGQLLQRLVRGTDCLAKSGASEFSVAAGSFATDSARPFAARLCRAVAGAGLLRDAAQSLIASCGLVSLSSCIAANAAGMTLEAMLDVARCRASAGMERSVTGPVGPEEELAFRKGA